MKRVVHFIVLAILTAMVLPCALAIAQSNYTPHENPATAETNYDIAMPILLHYSTILDLLASEEYEDIDSLIQEMDLDRAKIPEDIKSIMQIYNSLLSDLTTNLNDLDGLLGEAEAFLNQNKHEEARLKIIDADELVEEIESLLEDMNSTNDQLTGELVLLTLAAEMDAVNEASSRLQDAIEKLETLKSEYEALLQELETEVEQKKTLDIPGLTLGLDKSQAWVGDSITVSGILTSTEGGGQPLPNRKIIILLNGEDEVTATTDSNGQYQTEADEVIIPYSYISKVTVQASYIPEGNDIGKYASSFSSPVDIEPLFYSTELTLEVQERAYPGLPYMVNGQITCDAEAPSIEREIDLYCDDVLLDTIYSDQDVFEIEVIHDKQIKSGEHILTVVVNSQERFSSTFVNKTIIIVKESPEITIDNISSSILSRKIRVEGTLHSELSLQGAMVSIELKDASTTALISADGKFEATLSLSLDSIVIGNQEVKVIFNPSEAWHLPAETNGEVFIVNILDIGLASAVFICIGLVLYIKRRGSLGNGGVDVLKPLFLPQERTDTALQRLERLEGIRARVFKAYIEAMVAVEVATKVFMKPYMTLREFLKDTKPGLDNAADSFTELTHLAENALYSPDLPGTDEAAKAESLTHTIKEKL